MKYDKDGVGVACPLIMKVITEENDEKVMPQLHDGIINAINVASTNQLSMSGRLYWLNVVVNLLQILSKQAKNLKSPREIGIVVPSNVSSKNVSSLPSPRDILGTFSTQLSNVSFSIYRALLMDMRLEVCILIFFCFFFLLL